MTNAADLPPEEPRAELGLELEERITSLVRSIVEQDPEEAAKDLEEVVVRTRDLIHRKQSAGLARSEVKDVLAEVMFSRLRRGFHDFVASQDAQSAIKAAEWVMGAMVTTTVLDQLAAALDRLLLDAASPREFSFAGLTDFISVEEVLQLLAAGGHRGCLSLENVENRLDIYLDDGHIAFLDPHKLYRRILPARGGQGYRELDPEILLEAERRHARHRVPIFLTLHERGAFGDDDVLERMRALGCEVLWDFLRDREACAAFFYRRMPELPSFASEYDLSLSVTPVLLEGNKRIDDWRTMCQVFPDPHEPVVTVPDLYARIADLDLDPLEIKMLASCNGHHSPRDLVTITGLPLQDVYQILVKLAGHGVIVAPGGEHSVARAAMTIEDSMDVALKALEANETEVTMGEALRRMMEEHAQRSANSPRDEMPDWLQGS